MKIAVVVSLFNEPITTRLLEGALAYLQEMGVGQDQLRIVKVPGAVEIPLIAQQLARTQSYQAVICLGAVIRGETSHYEWVCQQVSMGCQQVALTHQLPVIFGVLTTENWAQALDRVGGVHGHKGREAAATALKMIQLMDSLLEKEAK